MKITENTVTCKDSDYLSSDSDSSYSSSETPSSSDYVQTEEDADIEIEEEGNNKRVPLTRSRKSKRSIPVQTQRRGRIVRSAAGVIMERSAEPVSPRQPRLAKNKEASANKMKTRGKSNVNLTTPPADEVKKGEGSVSGSSCLKKAAPKLPGKRNVSRKGNKLSPAVVNAVFGNFQSSVADVEELSRKRDEDALKCGRVTRTVGQASKTESVLNEIPSPFEETVVSEDVNGDSRHSPEYNDSITSTELRADLSRIPSRLQKEVMERVEEGVNRSIVNEFSSKANVLHLQHKMSSTKALNSPTSRKVLDMSQRNEKDLHPYSDHEHEVAAYTESTGKGRWALVNLDEYDRREIGRQGVHSRRHESHRRLPEDLDNRRQPPNRVHESGSGRRRRSRSWSPTYKQTASERAVDLNVDIRTSRSALSRKMPREESSGHASGRVRRRSRDSSSTDSQYEYRRSVSPQRRCGTGRRSPSYLKSGSPNMSLVRVPPADGDGDGNEMKEKFRVTEDVVVLPALVDRRKRRQKQSIRESQKLNRETEGRKPYYLNVDIHGRPYGHGRPAWIAEINKLAAGLDPSCTDIRKQAHGDVCIFKDRLNDRFEYSEDVNEGYLRGFMGRAVTKRRTDLIAFINRGGTRPAHFNKNIWDRLEMLATSKQREQRSERGRYANSCRRTLGRTGALGEDGVRERLRELLGRSPDPDEMADEMQRDKGFGKKKVEALDPIKKQQQNDRRDVLGKDVMKIQSRSIRGQRISSDEGESEKEDSQVKFSSEASKRKEAVVEEHPEETEWVSRGRDLLSAGASEDFTDGKSKDDYIAQLEAELKKYRGYTGGKSNSTWGKSSSLDVCRREQGKNL